MSKLNEKIFREYDIRGNAEADLPSDVVEQIAKGIGTFMTEHRTKKITLGRDCRLSSERIRNAMVKGLLSCGIDVIDIGLVPTPLLYFSVFHLNTEGGIMITGSHNPGEYNGFKICVGKSTIHGEEILQIRDIVKKGSFSKGSGKESKAEVIESYIDYVVNNVKVSKPVNVVVDSGNGMGGIVAPKLYRRLGCQVTELFSELDGNFPNHHPDPTVVENLEEARKTVRAAKSMLAICFDGDADRIGVVDQSGEVLFGDELLAIYARDILKTKKGAKIISEVKASHRLYKDIAAHGGEPIMWKTGHSLIKSKMKETGALLAGEMSGHMFFNDRYFGYDDAIYAGARLLEIMANEGQSPSQLLSDLPKTVSTPEIRVDCPDETKFLVVDSAKSEFQRMGLTVNGIDGARVEFKDGWGLVRASNTQPVLVYRFEANSSARLNEIRSLMEGVISKHLQAA